MISLLVSAVVGLVGGVILHRALLVPRRSPDTADTIVRDDVDLFEGRMNARLDALAASIESLDSNVEQLKATLATFLDASQKVPPRGTANSRAASYGALRAAIEASIKHQTGGQ